MSDLVIHGLDRTQSENDDSTMNLTQEEGTYKTMMTGIDNMDHMSKHMDTKGYEQEDDSLKYLNNTGESTCLNLSLHEKTFSTEAELEDCDGDMDSLIGPDSSDSHFQLKI